MSVVGDCGVGIGEREALAVVFVAAGERGGVVRMDSTWSEVVEAGDGGRGLKEYGPEGSEVVVKCL